MDDFISDEIMGVQRLYNLWQELRGESIIIDWIVFNTWSFGDIDGTINKEGVRDEGLWQEAINDSLPEGVSIGTLLDSDEMIRIY